MKPDSNKIESDLVKKKNLARSDREFYRICPSKLTKHELEDLYFSLLESNWQQKKTIDEQAERIKSLLKIKQTRDSAQKVLQADERKDCCISTKYLVHQQKQSITNLRRENERLAERIRKLNIKLSSVKQFSNIPIPSSRRLSTQSAANNSLYRTRENDVRSVDLQTEPPEEIDVRSLGIQTDLAIDTDSRSDEVQTEPETYREHHGCEENNCRTQIRDLQQTIVILQEELYDTHKEYTARISRLEKQVLHNSTDRLHSISQENFSNHEKHMNQLTNNLRAAGELSNELKIQLSIEKKKVTELVKQIKGIGIFNNLTHNKDTSTNTVDFEILEAEPESSGGEKCNCPRLSPRRISRLIHLYRKGLSMEQESCSKCCEELKFCKTNCTDTVKSSNFAVTNDDFTEEPNININQRNVNEGLNDDTKYQHKFNEALNLNAHDENKSANTHNIVKIQIQPELNQHMKLANNLANSNWNQNKIQDTSDSKKQQSSFDNSNRNCNLHINRIEDKYCNKIELPDHNKTQPLANVEKHHDKNMKKQDKFNNSINNNSSNNYHGVSEAVTNSVTNAHKLCQGYGPSNIVEPRKLNTNQDQMNTKSPSKENKFHGNKKEDLFTSNNYQISPGSESIQSSFELSAHEINKNEKTLRINTIAASPLAVYNDALNFGLEGGSKKICTPNNDKENVNRTLNESNIISETPHIDFNATKNEKLDARVGDDSAVAKNECVDPKHLERDILPIDRSSYDTPIDQSVKIPLLNYPEQNVPQNNLSLDANPMVKTRSEKIKGKRPPKSDEHNSLQIPGPIPISESTVDKTNIYKRFKKVIVERRNKTQNGKYKETPNHFSKELEKVDQVQELLPETVGKAIQARERGIKATESPLCQLDKIKGKHNSMSNLYGTAHTDECTNLTENHNHSASNATDKKAMYSEPKIDSELSMHRNSMVKRGVATYRRKSGTLCFKTIPFHNLQRSHTCQCDEQKPCGGLVNKGVQSDERSQTMTIKEQGTCFTECAECSRDTSLASTMLEKSYKVDPTEEQVKQLSHEKIKLHENYRLIPAPGASLYNMQEKLDAIAEELERCKQMMQSHCNNPEHSQENHESKILGDWNQARSQLTLKKGVARHDFSDAPAPRCVFTLHIGTVVLSDEAVLNSRNKSLILTWKFYDQNVSMTRMRAGRVVLFDFSTEYDILMTDEFLNYMKHEEMPIIICEVEKQEEPYARCSLPLRDALLHTNMRANMSIALVAGPQMIYARSQNSGASDALDTGDEMGVMDLWCMLKTDNILLPAINRAIKKENLYRWGSSVLRLPSKEVSGVISGKSDFSNIIPHVDKKQGCYKQEENNYDKHMSLSTRRNSSVLRLPNTVPIDRGAAYPRRDSNRFSGSYRDSYSKHETKKSTSLLNTYKDHLASFSKNKKTQEHELEPMVLLPVDQSDDEYDNISKKYDNIAKLCGYKTDPSKKSVTINSNSRFEFNEGIQEEPQKDKPYTTNGTDLQSIDITILWLALNEECEAISDPRIQRVYVAYSFLGRSGADLETPVSLPKPKHYVDKCYFNFKKSFQLDDEDIPLLGHMARCRSASIMSTEPRDCIVFSVISEPPDDTLSLESCEDIGYEYRCYGCKAWGRLLV